MRQAAEFRCQNCGLCEGEHSPLTGGIIKIEVAHLDQDKSNSDPENLRVLCRQCHAVFDAPFKAEKRRLTRARERKKRQCPQGIEQAKARAGFRRSLSYLVVECFGGPKDLWELLESDGVTYPMVASWRQNHFIPAQYHGLIQHAAKQEGIDLPDAVFEELRRPPLFGWAK